MYAIRVMFTFIESSILERILPLYLDDDEYSELQQFLMQNPEAGELVPGSGGVRKVRWGAARDGKARRASSHLLCTVPAERVLDAHAVRQSQAGGRPWAYSQAIVRDIPKWVRS